MSEAAIKPEDFVLSSKDRELKISRIELNNHEISEYLDSTVEKILNNRGVNHPFINKYRFNKLTKEQEKFLYLETYYYFLNVPFYICSLCTQTRDETLMTEILRNVVDEFGLSGTLPHSQIFLSFLSQIGITQEDIDKHVPLNSTTGLNKGIHDLYVAPPLEKALGALFAEETQSAAMVEKYNSGLENQGYSKSLRYFWEMHIEAEIGHSNAIYNCLLPYLKTNSQRELFEEGIEEYMNHLEKYWDGIEQVIINE